MNHHDFTLTRLEEQNVEPVRAAFSISHSRSYILGRLVASVCLTVKPDAGASPVTWALMHADESLGAMHVEAAYRRQALDVDVLVQVSQALRGTGNEEHPEGLWDYRDSGMEVRKRSCDQ